MEHQWLDLLRCPKDKGELSWRKHGPARNDALIPDGTLQCRACDAAYPVRDGIVHFLTSSDDNQMKRTEQEARDAAAEGYDQGVSPQRDALESAPGLSVMAPGPDDIVAELGCGTGRMTARFAPRVARTIAMDFSSQSLRVLQRKLAPELRPKVLLIQGDVCALPLHVGAFSKVVSFQVYEHLPSSDLLHSALGQGGALLSPKGQFVCSVYNWSSRKRRLAARGLGDNTQKEGFHATGIYYRNFEAHEFRAAMTRAGLEVDVLRGVSIFFRGARLLGDGLIPVNQVLSRTALGLRMGDLLLCRAHRAAA